MPPRASFWRRPESIPRRAGRNAPYQRMTVLGGSRNRPLAGITVCCCGECARPLPHTRPSPHTRESRYPSGRTAFWRDMEQSERRARTASFTLGWMPAPAGMTGTLHSAIRSCRHGGHLPLRPFVPAAMHDGHVWGAGPTQSSRGTSSIMPVAVWPLAERE